jgi:hypothetical protein
MHRTVTAVAVGAAAGGVTFAGPAAAGSGTLKVKGTLTGRYAGTSGYLHGIGHASPTTGETTATYRGVITLKYHAWAASARALPTDRLLHDRHLTSSPAAHGGPDGCCRRACDATS